jgi:hypothetical protein
MNDIDIPVDRFEVSEIILSHISGEQLRILRQVKSKQRCLANHPVTASYRLVAWLIRRMNDQQLTLSPELFVKRANHGSIQRGDSIRLVPAISRDQHQTCAVWIAEVHA